MKLLNILAIKNMPTGERVFIHLLIEVSRHVKINVKVKGSRP